jgi:hypothetical protein
MAKRRKFTSEFKARVVLEELTGVKDRAEICREYRLSRLGIWMSTEMNLQDLTRETTCDLLLHLDVNPKDWKPVGYLCLNNEAESIATATQIHLEDTPRDERGE